MNKSLKIKISGLNQIKLPQKKNNFINSFANIILLYTYSILNGFYKMIHLCKDILTILSFNQKYLQSICSIYIYLDKFPFKKTLIQKVLLAFISLILYNPLQAQELPYQYSLFSDKEAKQIDDIITVLIEENAKAKNDTRTETDIDQRAGFDMAPGRGKLKNWIPSMGFGFNQETDYDGRGKTARSGEVKARVSARIITIYDNGNMLIEGHKEVEINNETEIIRVTGIIRPEDIAYDNSIYSSKIANAKIQYTGKGDSQNAHRPGVFTRFVNWIF